MQRQQCGRIIHITGASEPSGINAANPANMAYLVASLCSPKARDLTGERIHVDGGYRRAY
jgi:NAD(P)-dependent dehydrogenase (short-subunit alcohol dehydrogenase family)